MIRNKTAKIIIILLALAITMPSALYPEEKAASLPADNQTSNLISLNLKEVNIEDALKIIAEASGMNVILDRDVKARINITLKDVTWQTALDNILKTNELTYRIQGNIIRIMTLATMKKEEEIIPLVTKIMPLSFAKAEDIQKSLTKIISARGSIEISVPTNSLIVTDTPETMSKIENVIAKLDTRTPQVLIETLIVSVKLTDKFYSGLDYVVTSKSTGTRHVNQKLGLVSNAVASVFDWYYGSLSLGNWSVNDIKMNFLASDERVTILAEPKVLTLDNLAAQIEIIEQIPYTYVSTSNAGGGNNGSTVTSTQFKEAGIKLYLTPHITKDKFISLAVRGEQSFRSGYAGTTSEPIIDSRKVETNFMIRDGDTVVIGGLKKKELTNSVQKVPILGDIPFFGKLLFSQIKKDAVETELLIFITTHIMEDAMLTRKEDRNFQDARDDLAGLDTKKKQVLKGLRETEIYRALNKASKSSAK